ncbi:pep-cterm sorting domain-containing protein [Anaeramoeba ignava]|uniref:Pep-cterm sorting domain-containing protein n=1 Tax=Anaeramoeba ignava TaxID=1746090 RepID=A0A9Q0R8R4_ANAIG|nr:pep-cterm sorting domain-containing protein [Anaeramoeba ignava]
MELGFSAKRDFFDCNKWHSKCDNKGKTLVIIKTKDNFIFGGFTQVGWTTDRSKWKEEEVNNPWGYIIDPKSFIFSLRNDKNDRKSEKFKIKSAQTMHSIFYYSEGGPSFGRGLDICIRSNLKDSYSNFGYSYHLPHGVEYNTKEAKSYLAGSYNHWVVDELETYFI